MGGLAEIRKCFIVSGLGHFIENVLPKISDFFEKAPLSKFLKIKVSLKAEQSNRNCIASVNNRYERLFLGAF